MTDAITQLALITRRTQARANAGAEALVERQRQALAAKGNAMAGPWRPDLTGLEPTSAHRLALKLRGFRYSLAPDEAAVLDGWLERALRASQT